MLLFLFGLFSESRVKAVETNNTVCKYYRNYEKCFVHTWNQFRDCRSVVAHIKILSKVTIILEYDLICIVYMDQWI